jgi:pimeloyl-ACP methyl ester carboxylesterase
MSDQPWPSFRWLERGAGQPVVLLHGLMGHMHQWDPILDHVAARERAIALHLPIFEPTPSEASIPALVSHLVRFLDALEIERAVVGGHGLGGHVALETALTHPARVDRLLLSACAGGMRAGRSEAMLDSTLVTPELVPAIHARIVAPRQVLRVLRFAGAARAHTLADRLAGVALPTLLIWGRDDRVTPVPIGERLCSLIAGSELVVLNTCGHVAMVDQPHLFAAITRRWLERRRISRGVR